MSFPEKEHLTYRELAALLDVKLGTLYAWVARKEIPHVRLGRRVVRFRVQDIKDWLEKRKAGPNA